MNLRFETVEQMEAYERRRRAIEYDICAQPILHEMMKLRALFTSPWMIVRGKTVVESGEKWTDDHAATLYRKYEASLELLKLQILNPQ